MSEPHDPAVRQAIGLETVFEVNVCDEALRRQRERLMPWLRHHDYCRSLRPKGMNLVEAWRPGDETDCDCGLAVALGYGA